MTYYGDAKFIAGIRPSSKVLICPSNEQNLVYTYQSKDLQGDIQRYYCKTCKQLKKKNIGDGRVALMRVGCKLKLLKDPNFGHNVECRPQESTITEKSNFEVDSHVQQDDQDTEQNKKKTRRSGWKWRRKCIVEGCVNKEPRESDVNLKTGEVFPDFFSLPVDFEQAVVWIRLLISGHYSQLQWCKKLKTDDVEKFRICARHFIDGSPTEENPIPTLFLPQPEKSHLSETHPVLHDSLMRKRPRKPRKSYNAIKYETPTTTSFQQSCAFECTVRSCPIISTMRKQTGGLFRMIRLPAIEPHRSEWIDTLKLADSNWTDPGRFVDIWICERHFRPEEIGSKGIIPSLYLSERKDEESSFWTGVAYITPACCVTSCPVVDGMLKVDKNPYKLWPIPEVGPVRQRWLAALIVANCNFKPAKGNNRMHICERHFVDGIAALDRVPCLFLSPVSSDEKKESEIMQSNPVHLLPPRKVAGYYCTPKSSSEEEKWCCREVGPMKNSVRRIEGRVSQLESLINIMHSAANNSTISKVLAMKSNQQTKATHALLKTMIDLKDEIKDIKVDLPVKEAIKQRDLDVAKRLYSLKSKQQFNTQNEGQFPILSWFYDLIEESDVSKKKSGFKPGPRSFKERKLAEYSKKHHKPGPLSFKKRKIEKLKERIAHHKISTKEPLQLPNALISVNMVQGKELSEEILGMDLKGIPELHSEGILEMDSKEIPEHSQEILGMDSKDIPEHSLGIIGMDSKEIPEHSQEILGMDSKEIPEHSQEILGMDSKEIPEHSQEILGTNFLIDS